MSSMSSARSGSAIATSSSRSSVATALTGPTPSMTSDTAAGAEVSEARDQVASKLVDRFALWSGVAGLVPLPVVDVLAVGGLQLQMLRRLSQIYGVEFSQNRGKALIAALAGCMIPATSGMGAASALKAVPVLNILAAGFIMPGPQTGQVRTGTPGWMAWVLFPGAVAEELGAVPTFAGGVTSALVAGPATVPGGGNSPR